MSRPLDARFEGSMDDDLYRICESQARSLAVPAYGALEGIARELDQLSSPISLVRAGLYAEIGTEIV
jgi:hypothetical protein